MLGDISPQTVRIAENAVVYPGRNHVTTLTIKRYNGRNYKPVDLDNLTRVVLVFPDTTPTIAFDSLTDSVFTWGGNVLTIDLSDYAMPNAVHPSHLIVFDAEHLQGQVLVDDLDSRIQFDFRLISTTGALPPPTVEFITDAPQDGDTYGRKDGAWVSLESVVSGVASVNGQSGIVVLDATDVGAATTAQGALADSAVQPGDLAAVATSGAYADLSGKPTLGTAAAANTGDFDPAGAAAGAVSAHVSEPDPHPQYQTQAEGDARYERGLIAGTNVTIDRTNPAAPVISAAGGSSGEANTASNLGSGVGLFAQKSGVDLQFKGLVAGANVTITPSSTGVTIAAAGGGGGAVDSVNGKTGVVVLDAADVGADPEGSAVNARFQSTGLISGGALSINGTDNTTFDVAAGMAVFANYTNPAASTATIISFGPLTLQAVPALAVSNASYIGINSAGTIVQQTTQFTNTQRRSIVSLGAVVHSNNTNLNAVNTIVSANRQLLNQFGDGIRAIGQLNLSGTVYSSVGANLQMQRTAGELFSPGANFHVDPDNPHSVSVSAQNPVSFRYRLANSTEYTDRTLADPANYDNAGVLTAVPANRYTVQLIAVFQSGITRLQYGQELHNQLADAVAAAQTQSMVVESNIADNGVIRGYLVLRGNATALDSTAQAVFVTLSKFGASTAVSPLSIATTDELAEGTTNLYHTAPRVRTTLLTGLSLVTNAAITAIDTVLDALGKLQKQITDLTTAVSGKQAALVSGTNIKTVDGNSLLGPGDLVLAGLTNPMTAAGDIIVGGASGVPNRLAAGSTGAELSIVTGSPVWANRPSFSAGATASTTLPTSIATKVSFQTEEYDVGSNFASSRFTAPVTGRYKFQGAVALVTNVATVVLAFYRNGVLYKRFSASGVGAWSGVVDIPLNAGDYVEVYFTQNAATQNTFADPAYTFFQGSLEQRW